LIFNTDSADLGAEGRQQLLEVAEVLKAFPNVQIKLNGHADNAGDRASNKLLSSSRAAVVKEELTKAGVAANRMTTDSFSAARPIASNATEGGRQQNRRVEIAITKR
jgi:outer membrane protein OmpA-like peptidoglycan-associated protein